MPDKDSPMRILMVVGKMDRGGMETMIMNLYRAADPSALQFDFLCTRPGEGAFDGEIAALGGGIYHTEEPGRAGILPILSQMQSLMSAHGPYHAVHAHLLFFNGLVLAAAKKAGIPVRISHSHASALLKYQSARGKIYSFLMRILIRRYATVLLACSKSAGVYLYGANAVRANKVTVLANSVDVSLYQTKKTEELAALQREFSIPADALVILQVGRMIEEKNHAYLIKVAGKLKMRGVSFRLIFAGDGPLRESLSKTAAQSGLQQEIHFAGVRPDIPALLQLAHVFAMPSLYEGLPVALVEAQAAGLSCVASTGISRESDLGLSLVSFLPIDDASVDAWAVKLIAAKNHIRPDMGAVQSAFEKRGYDVKNTMKKLSAIYGGFE